MEQDRADCLVAVKMGVNAVMISGCGGQGAGFKL